MFNLVFDLWYIVAAFSMFHCLLGEVVSYLFTTHQEKRRARKNTQAPVVSVNFVELLRTPLFKNISGDCFWRWTRWNQTTGHDIPIEKTFSLNDSLWIILATRQNGHVVTFFCSRPKLKWGNEKFHFCTLLKRATFLNKQRCNRTQCTQSVTPLIFRRTIFPCRILTTYIIQNIYKRWINQQFI